MDFIMCVCVVACLTVTASTNIPSLAIEGINKWQPEVFSGETVYTMGHYKERMSLQAISDNSASGLVLKKRIDLTKTPYINWSWLIENKLFRLDERSESGDDFVARIYMVVDGGLLFWQTKSLNYVWSSNQDKGMIWDNPFAGSSVKIMSIRGRKSKIGKWYEEKRHVYKDFIKAFGDKGSEAANLKAYKYIDVVAIMTDTDNSGKEAESYYGDITFSAM